MDEAVGRRAPRFVYLTDAAPDPADDAPPRFGWRLVAANRRPLGRGVRLTGSFAECRADAGRARAALDVAAPSVVSSDGRWAWRLSVGGDPVAVSVRAYLRRVECLRGLRQFDVAARTADPDDGVLRAFGAHALIGYEDVP